MEATSRASVRTVDSLGKVTYEVKPNTSNIVAGFIVGLGLIGGGLFLTGSVIREAFFAGGNAPQNANDWLMGVISALLGIGIAVGGGLMVKFARSLVGFRLRVCSDGFWFTRPNQQFVYAWDEIVRVKESVVEETLPMAKGPARRLMPTKKTHTYTVVRCDGEQFYFDENVIPRTSLLAGPLKTAAKARGIEWETEQTTA